MNESTAKRVPAKSALAVAAEAAAVLEKEVIFSVSSMAPEDWKTWYGKVLDSVTSAGNPTYHSHACIAGRQFVLLSFEQGLAGPGYLRVVYLDTGLHAYISLDLCQKGGARFRYVPGRVYVEKEMTTAQLAGVIGSRAVKGSMGSDPEMFAVDSEGNLIPSFEYLGPKPLKAEYGEVQKNASSVYWDGYQGEFSHRSFNCINYGTDYIRSGLSNMYDALQLKFKGARLSLRSTFEIPPKRLESDHPQYVQFGCMPSKSAYGEPFKTYDPFIIPFRTAGGHLHFGYTGNVEAAVKALDRILGVISVSLFRHWENPQRRLLYGRAGEYRVTPYGFEYRVLSNAWLCHPMMVHLMFELSRRAFGISAAGEWKRWNATEEEVRRCINDSDVKLAEEILKRNSTSLDGLLASLPGCGLKSDGSLMDTTATLKDMVLRGVHHYLKDPDYPSSAWGLGQPEVPAEGNDPGDTNRYRLYSNGPSGRLYTGLAYAAKNKMLD